MGGGVKPDRDRRQVLPSRKIGRWAKVARPKAPANKSAPLKRKSNSPKRAEQIAAPLADATVPMRHLCAIDLQRVGDSRLGAN